MGVTTTKKKKTSERIKPSVTKALVTRLLGVEHAVKLLRPNRSRGAKVRPAPISTTTTQMSPSAVSAPLSSADDTNAIDRIEVERSIVEELVGNFSSSALVTLATTASTVALMADPVVGTGLFILSIVYGSCMKAMAGVAYKKHRRRRCNGSQRTAAKRTSRQGRVQSRMLTRSMTRVRPEGEPSVPNASSLLDRPAS